MKLKKFVSTIIIISLLCFIFAGCGTKAENENNHENGDLKITDTLGRDVTIPEGSDKFVCIGPGCLRLYCYVGDTSKLVGIEDIEKDTSGRPYIMANDDLITLPIIGLGGPNNAPDAEKLLEVVPDVIFSMYNSDVSSVNELQEKTGIPVVALSYGNTEVFDNDVDLSIQLIGKVTDNQKRADEVIDYFNELEADLNNRTKDIDNSKKPTVYLGAQSMRGAHGIESTSGNYSLFNAIGARNVVDEANIDQYIMLDKEALLDMDPDIIIIDAGGLSLVLDDYNKNKSFYEGLNAVKNNKLYLQLPYNHYYTNIDIALADAYYIGSVLYPEQFSDINPEKKFDEITQKLLGKELYKDIAKEYFGGYQQINLDK
ncbi:iron ABC transporter substrate-binding protein [Anaerovorax odorimutans]|uniref:iron ABC transporter substrate-binding protein n=1 Tax=Anaerovorax odorimutans TaxID=109327 RepID=UPI00041A063D|nr:iron ABC transporter substrate-binding protein [Anaerovorax odorimutans]